MSDHANARPRKRFFIDMFTRDLALEDCVLDLIDNSIDALFRQKKIEYFDDILVLMRAKRKTSGLPEININYNDDVFVVKDNCGGISFEIAKNHVFNFGHEQDHEHAGKLGVYGIGLKRAVFKIGNQFGMVSRTNKDGFSLSVDIAKWVKKDDTLDDWVFDITKEKGVAQDQAGTKIEISKLNESVLSRLNDGNFEALLRKLISMTYSLFLEKKLRIKVNNKIVEPYVIPLGGSEELTPSSSKKKYDGVNAQFIATIAEPNEAKAEKSGWYIFCNGRMVVGADKSNMTGWESNPVIPAWHTKYTAFIGLAFLTSEDPLALPWSTTKRDINRESKVFQQARGEMQKIARPILDFCNKKYTTNEQLDVEERRVADSVQRVDLLAVAQKPTAFKVKISKEKVKTKTKIGYDVENIDFDRVKKALRHPEWKPGQVGEYTFNYFMKRECAE